MADSNISLTKTCKNCGLEKPLSSFLVVSGAEAGTYGNFCSDCRKTAPQVEREGAATSATGFKIDSKTKVQAEIDKRKQRKEITEQYFDERDKRGLNFIKKTEATLTQSKNEVRHRSFLDSRKPAKTEKKADTPVFGGETQHAEARRFNFNAPVEDTRIAGKMKHQSETFKRFSAWLGNSAPIVQAVERASNSKADIDKPELAPLNKSKKP